MSGKLIVSLDFELFWGMQDGWKLEEYEENVLGGRKAIPQILRLFERHDIHATWATVGFLFADNYNELRKFFPELKPTYRHGELSSYRCFGEIGEDELTAPCFYGASLVKAVSQCPGQEIGTHTFSHYYCREEGQTPEQFRQDMKAAQALAEAKGYSLQSVVFPRNQCTPEAVEILKELGFLSYRDEENDWIHHRIKSKALLRMLRLSDVYLPLTGQGGYEPELSDGLVNLPGSRMLKPIFPPLKFLEWLKIRRIKTQMRHAARKGLTFHLWWHPHNFGIMTEKHLQQLEDILNYYDQLKQKYNMRSLNMMEAAKERLQENP